MTRNVVSELLHRRSENSADVASVENRIGALMRERERLHQERDLIRTALAALEVEDE